MKWKDYGSEFNSWEPETNINAPELFQLYIQSRGGVVEFSKKKIKAKSPVKALETIPASSSSTSSPTSPKEYKRY